MRKPVRAETVAQASSWEAVKRNAVAFGLCESCAAQLAWAHQDSAGGFGSVHPPCDACRELLRSLPVGRPNGWRTVDGSASRSVAWPVNHVSDRQAVETPEDAPAGFNAARDAAQVRSRHRLVVTE